MIFHYSILLCIFITPQLSIKKLKTYLLQRNEKKKKTDLHKFSEAVSEARILYADFITGAAIHCKCMTENTADKNKCSVTARPQISVW